jgi:hypothetical protein
LVPALTLIPTVIVMFFLAIMSFELLHGMWGYRQPAKVSGGVVRWVADLCQQELPKD